MAAPGERWWNQPQLWVEWFVILNIGFLTFDIYLAHNINQFRKPAEYVPFFFSAGAPVVLIAALWFRNRRPLIWKLLGQVVGWAAISIGLAGVVLHLQSHFF